MFKQKYLNVTCVASEYGVFDCGSTCMDLGISSMSSSNLNPIGSMTAHAAK